MRHVVPILAILAIVAIMLFATYYTIQLAIAVAGIVLVSLFHAMRGD